MSDPTEPVEEAGEEVASTEEAGEEAVEDEITEA